MPELAALLASLEPALQPGRFVFVSLPRGTVLDPALVVASIVEPEGLSVIVPEQVARERGLAVAFSAAWITLSVNSDLDAVGLTAAFATALGEAGISCNVVAGVHHDHLFVPADQAQPAMDTLRALQRTASAPGRVLCDDRPPGRGAMSCGEREVPVPPGYRIRAACRADTETLVAFTLREASESQGLEADSAAVRRGVAAAFDEPPRARYWVVEAPGGECVASTSVTTEWSDFHGADYWWVQSLYIVPEQRGRGLLEALLAHLQRAAAAAGAVELRLYVHEANARAIRAYERCGFVAAPYTIMRRAPAGKD